MSNAAFINALMEEGTKQDCLEQVVKLWNENCELRNQLVRAGAIFKQIEVLGEKVSTIDALTTAIRAGNLAHAARIELGLTDETIK